MSIEQLDSHLAERVRSREVAEAHFVAEVSNDPTRSSEHEVVRPDPHVGGRRQRRDRHAAGPLRHPRRAASLLRWRRGPGAHGRVDLFTSLGGEWYGFVHGLATGKVLATGESYTAELSGSSPRRRTRTPSPARSGCRGRSTSESKATRPVRSRSSGSRRGGPTTRGSTALRSGDPARVAARYAPDAQCAMRHPLSARSPVSKAGAVGEYYPRSCSRPRVRAVDVVARLVDRWFVFTELVMRLRLADGRRSGRTNGGRLRDRPRRHHPRPSRHHRRPGADRRLTAWPSSRIADSTPVIRCRSRCRVRGTSPRERYYDRGFYELEKQYLWPRVWQMACRLEEIPSPATGWSTRSATNRSSSSASSTGSLKAFYNVCPHRATQLCQGTGRAAGNQITCPFHGWRWDIDGTNAFVYGAAGSIPSVCDPRTSGCAR